MTPYLTLVRIEDATSIKRTKNVTLIQKTFLFWFTEFHFERFHQCPQPCMFRETHGLAKTLCCTYFTKTFFVNLYAPRVNYTDMNCNSNFYVCRGNHNVWPYIMAAFWQFFHIFPHGINFFSVFYKFSFFLVILGPGERKSFAINH